MCYTMARRRVVPALGSTRVVFLSVHIPCSYFRLPHSWIARVMIAGGLTGYQVAAPQSWHDTCPIHTCSFSTVYVRVLKHP
jgi:hypothetical protein